LRCAAVFPDLDSARAAFALGPVRYRCLVCGREHVSGRGEGLMCLALAASDGGQLKWLSLPGPFPPAPAVPPFLVFVRCAWNERVKVHLHCAEAIHALELTRAEYVLAVDPLGLERSGLEGLLEDMAEKARPALDCAWEEHGRLAAWVRKLPRVRPGAAVAYSAVQEWSFPEGFPVVRELDIRPAAPLPGTGEHGVIKVPAEALERYGPPGRAGAKFRLAAAGYGRECFVAVFARACLSKGGESRVRELCVLREPYGGKVTQRLVHFDAGYSAEEAMAFVRDILEREGVDAPERQD